jgi:hypothetical protein
VPDGCVSAVSRCRAAAARSGRRCDGRFDQLRQRQVRETEVFRMSDGEFC